MRKRILRALPGVLCLLVGLPVLTVQPAQAAEVRGNIKVCNSSDGFTGIRVFDLDNSDWDEEGSYGLGYCTGWMWPGGIRVDTDPYGPSHSYKIKRVNVANGYTPGYASCHTDSDNHESDPPNPPSNEDWIVYYKNYDHGNCTN